jgi:hypothetical protein
MSFTDSQVRQLKSSVRRRHVREREVEGKTLHYLEGWWIVSEANRIFGFDAWERETVSSECVWRSPVGERFGAAYLTRVRISVRAGERVIVREGLGAGEAVASTPGQAHERASKAAETDATKRALSTFGSRFGLSLYGERGDAAKIPHEGSAPEGAAARAVRSVGDRMRSAARVNLERPPVRPDAKGAGPNEPDTHRQAVGEAPEAQNTHEPAAPGQASAGGTGNDTRAATDPAPQPQPDTTTSGVDIQTPEGGAPIPSGGADGAPSATTSSGGREVALIPVYFPPPPQRIDKSALAIPEPRRLRDRHHLKFVARQPCLACGRTPSQAHHLRIAQPRALGRKVSDEFTVPLCALHHHDLHMKGNEGEWWNGRAIEPLPVAESLWRQSRGLPDAPEAGNAALQDGDTQHS